MEYQINDVPFEMNQISAKLFNTKFLSDVTFIVEGKHIYAHSLELMKRSTVFQQQLEPTWGEKKIIPITNYKYETFYQFIRFIYTDEFDRANNRELLKLANAYNVIRLINGLLTDGNNIEKLDFCITTNYKIALNDSKLKLASRLEYYLESDTFLSIHPDTIEQILNLDQISNRVKETDLLNALVHWMRYGDHQNLEKLIRLIRFPTMSTKELRDIRMKYPNLLSNNDFLNIAGQKIYGPRNENNLWNCTPRMEFISPYEQKEFPSIFEFQAKFTVSSDMMILGGFVLGSNSDLIQRISITISCLQPPLNEIIEEIKINVGDFWRQTSSVINLGTSIRIQPNFIYTIAYKYSGKIILIDGTKKYWSRKPETELIINGPPDSVKIWEAHETMHEIMFLERDNDQIDEHVVTI